MHNCDENIIRQFECYDWKEDTYVCSVCGKRYYKEVTMSTTGRFQYPEKVELVEITDYPADGNFN